MSLWRLLSLVHTHAVPSMEQGVFVLLLAEVFLLCGVAIGQESDSPIVRADLAEAASSLFFIVGTSRSGTTLLQAILNAHSCICIPPETHFFTYENEFDWQISRLFDAGGVHSFVEFLFEEKRRLDDLDLRKEQMLRRVDQLDVTSNRALFLLVAALYRKQVGKDIVGEKTPRHLLHAEKISGRYPKARFLILFRDPRAKALSERKVPFGSPSLFVSARRWRRYVREYRRLTDLLSSDQYYQTTYEAIVRHTEAEVRRIASFLGVDFEENMLAFYDRDDLEKGYPDREDWKQNTMKPIQEDHIDKWKGELSAREIELVEQTAGAYLEEMGYDPVERESISTGELVLTWARDYWKAVRKDIREVLGR